MVYFNENVGGLNRGAPVLFKGIPIGQVLDVTLEFDSANRTFRIPVLVAIEPERFQSNVRYPHRGRLAQDSWTSFVQRGMRAQLVTANFLTGQQAVAFDFFPNAKPATVNWGGAHPELPTIPGQFEQVGDRVHQLITRLEKIPIEQIAGNLRDTLEGTKRVANSPEILKTIKSLDAAIQELQAFTHELRTRTSPELVAAMQQARTSLASASSALESDSPLQSRMKGALEEITSAARSLRVLADYLERYPQSLLVGKDAPQMKRTPPWNAAALCLLCMILAGCFGTSRPIEYFTLTPLPAPGGLADGGTATVVAVLPVAIPASIDRPQIVTRTAENQLSLSEYNRWGGSLKEDIGRTLVQNLNVLLKGRPVSVVPETLAVDPRYLISP